MSLAEAWDHATLAACLLVVDPGLGGIHVRARAGPVRDAFTAGLPAGTRLHPNLTDDALFGGVDLAETLANGRLVTRSGLLDRPGFLTLTMAERTPLHMAARLALTLDKGAGHCLIALDESVEHDEGLPPALCERLAFSVDLTDIALNATAWPVLPAGDARAAVTFVTTPPTALAQIVGVAAQLGINSLRAPLFALRAAKAHAALMGRNVVNDDDIAIACALTLAHRATIIPDSTPPDDEAPPPDTGDSETQSENLTLPDEILLASVVANLPPDLLARIAARKARHGKGSGTGAAHKGNRRGRPLPSVAGKKSDGARIDLVATLRAAAPWQTIRAAQTGRPGLQIRSADLRVKRFEERSDRLLIFTVDASGSAALARLAEAKGAVELLLAQAYARRDHVALVAFRGTGAETLLPPTRSLVQTKRRLAGLPGGGGTPLAAGLAAALEQALLGKRKGMTPTVCILTDGRANIARDGSADRPRAAADAQDMARIMRAQGVDALVIDTGNRPEQKLRDLAAVLGAPYLPLPRADAGRLSQAVAAALGD
jgi:magnesium chelatase subunit D